MSLTLEQLQKCIPDAGELVPIYLEALNSAMAEFEISNLARQATFLAQICHESGSLKYVREIWGPTAAQLAYEGREDLGNTQQGDGPRFKGRGLIQITGRKNYEAVSLGLGRNVVNDFAYLETPIGASRSAAWFFKTRGCNVSADLGNFWDVSKTINGGTNGLNDRIRHYVRIRRVLGI